MISRLFHQLIGNPNQQWLSLKCGRAGGMEAVAIQAIRVKMLCITDLTVGQSLNTGLNNPHSSDDVPAAVLVGQQMLAPTVLFTRL